jgi:hypothetical protein
MPTATGQFDYNVPNFARQVNTVSNWDRLFLGGVALGNTTQNEMPLNINLKSEQDGLGGETQLSGLARRRRTCICRNCLGARRQSIFAWVFQEQAF